MSPRRVIPPLSVTAGAKSGSDLAEYYEREYVHVDEAGFEEKIVADIKADLLFSIFPAGEKIGCFLEIGAGGGNILRRVVRKTNPARAVGMDLSFAALEKAKEQAPGVHFVCASGEKLPFKDDSFDLSLSMDVCEHVLSPDALLREQARVSKLLLIKVPIEKNLSLPVNSAALRLFLLARWIIRGKPMTPPFDPHVVKFSQPAFEKLIRKAGLVTLKRTVTGTPDSPDFDETLFRKRKELALESGAYPARARAIGKWFAFARTALKKLCFAVSPALYARAFNVHLYLLCVKPDGGRRRGAPSP
ncbi:MAG: class I SAM-dependent methyltransferase [bacterium]